MLSGKRPFDGEDMTEVLGAVVRLEPAWEALPADVPPPVRTLLQSCLVKDPRQRVAKISIALFVLDKVAGLAPPAILPAITATATPPQPLWKRAIPAAAAAHRRGGARYRRLVEPPAGPRRRRPSRVSHFPSHRAKRSLTAESHLVGMSPDGTRMVYPANARLYLRSAWDLEPKGIPGTDSRGTLRTPVFSPDGQSLAFYSEADQALKRIAVSGGVAVTLCPADYPWGMSWSVDGIVFGQGSKGILRVSPNGGQPERLVSVKDGEFAHGPQILPGGQTVLLTIATGTAGDRWDKAQVVVQSLKSGERKTLVNGGTDARYVPTGHIVYALGGTLFAIPFDTKRLEVAGDPVPIVEGVRRTATGASAGAAQFSFSDTGSLVYIPGAAGVSGRMASAGAGRSERQLRDPETSTRRVPAPSHLSRR